MRIQLIAIGSTGDVQPMVVLGRELSRRGHTVSIAAFSALRPLVEKAGFAFFPLPGDAERFIGSIMQPGASPFTYLSRLENALQSVACPLFDALYAACEQADAVVTTYFGSTVYAIAERLRIPLFQVCYAPMDPTGACCLPVMPPPRLGPAVNRATFRLGYLLIGGLERRYAHPWCQGRGLRARPVRARPDYAVADRQIPVLYAYSELLFPRPREWGPNLHATGFWMDERPDYAPPEDLLSFLSAGPPPVYIGFGSMNAGDGAAALASVLKALQKTRQRAVLSSGWGGLLSEAPRDLVYAVHGYVPHGFLMERVRAAVHHGGAGTTAACLSAGVPCLAVPFGGDQFFWGDRIHALGLGPKPLPRTRLRPGPLAARLQDLLENPAYLENAKRLQAGLRREDGPRAAADRIEAELAHWNA